MEVWGFGGIWERSVSNPAVRLVESCPGLLHGCDVSPAVLGFSGSCFSMCVGPSVLLAQSHQCMTIGTSKTLPALATSKTLTIVPYSDCFKMCLKLTICRSPCWQSNSKNRIQIDSAGFTKRTQNPIVDRPKERNPTHTPAPPEYVD